MRTECFEFKRCCCCLPLRYGLLVLGYLKLAVSLLVILPFSGSINLPPAELVSRLEYMGMLALIAFCILVILGDLALNIVFLVGGHKKCPKLLRVYKYYSIVILVVYVAAYILFHGFHLYFLIRRVGIIYSSLILRSSLTFGALNICFQVYIILITKAEITKLENNHSFRFSNNANEAECTMDEEGNIIENGSKNGEIEIEDHNENNTETYIKTSQPEYHDHNEGEENYRTEKNLNGNYVKLV